VATNSTAGIFSIVREETQMSDIPTKQGTEHKSNVIVGPKGDPFPTPKSAKLSMAQRDMDFNEYEIVPYEDGFAIAKRDPSQIREVPVESKKHIDPKTVTGTVGEPEKYFRVRFDPKSSPNDPEKVTLGVNGDLLSISREVEVILPARFVECAEHAVRQTFKQLPGQERKVGGKVRTFPFRILGESSKEEYHAMKAVGDAEMAALKNA